MRIPFFVQPLKQNGRWPNILGSSFVGTTLLTAGYFFLPVSSGALFAYMDWLALLAIPVVAGIAVAIFTRSSRIPLASLFLTAVCTVVILLRLKYCGFLFIGVIFWLSSLLFGGILGYFCRKYVIERNSHPQAIRVCLLLILVVPLTIVYWYGYQGLFQANIDVDKAINAVEGQSDLEAKRSVDILLSKSNEWPISPSDRLLGDVAYGVGNDSENFWRKYRELISACRAQKKYDLAIALRKRQLTLSDPKGNEVSDLELGEINFEAGNYSGVNEDTYNELMKEAQIDFHNGGMRSAAQLLSKLVAVKNDPNCHFYLANALLCLGRLSEAKSEYRQALLFHPNSELTQCCNKALAGADSLIVEEGYVGLYLKDDLVCSVSPESSAEKMGVKCDDKILAINHSPVAGQNSEEISRMIRGPIGTTVSVRLEHQGKQHDVILTRAKLDDKGIKQRQEWRIKKALEKRGICLDNGVLPSNSIAIEAQQKLASKMQAMATRNPEGPFHQEDALKETAKAFEMQGKFEQAETCWKNRVQLYKNDLDPKNLAALKRENVETLRTGRGGGGMKLVNILRTLDDLACFYRRRKNHEKEEKVLSQSQSIRQAILPEALLPTYEKRYKCYEASFGSDGHLPP